MANPDRKGGGGLSLQTLVIASAASLTAALVTSRLFAHGTLFVSAVTPVIVAAVSELLHRPANAAAELRRQRRTMVLEAREREAASVAGGDSAPLRGAPDFALGAEADQLGTTNGAGVQPPITVQGRTEPRRIHPKVWIVTGLAAFAIAIAVLTLPELLFGGAVANQHRTTFFGGGATTRTQPKTETKTETTQSQTAPKTVTETVPSETSPPAQQAPTTTETTPTQTQTTPTGTQTAPADTGTTTTSPADTVPLP